MHHELREDPTSWQDELDLDKHWHDECGVFGIYMKNPQETADSARAAFYGLYALQHRGQESAGIAVSNGHEILLHKDMGLVSEAFSPEIINKLQGHIAIGHVRYSTTGSSLLVNAQPLVFRYLNGMLALAHNGNLVNAGELRTRLATFGSVFQSTTDTEIIVNLLARYGQDSMEDALVKSMIDIKGAYALVLMNEKKLVGVRDPMGIRPLCLGRLDDNYVLASESCALDTVGAEFVRDIEPGEIIVIDENGITSINALRANRKAHCIFEYIYLARPDSVIDGVNVNRSRRTMGRQLARETSIKADIVIPVPDSGTSAALGFAEESGIRFEEGLIKNRYIGRTFIQPTQQMRDISVRLKLNPVIEAVKGQRVVLVDDSIVRGTTSKKIIANLRKVGAAEVHLVVASPPTVNSCFYGIDTSAKEELIASRMSVEQIREFIGADSLHYLSEEGMFSAFKDQSESFCAACFTGSYPIPVDFEKATKFGLEGGGGCS